MAVMLWKLVKYDSSEGNIMFQPIEAEKEYRVSIPYNRAFLKFPKWLRTIAIILLQID